MEGQHRPVDLEAFRQLAFLEEHRLALEEEDHQEELRQDFSHLQGLAVHLEGLPLGFNLLLDSKGRLVKEEDFHHQGLVGDDGRYQPEAVVLRKLAQCNLGLFKSRSRYQRKLLIQMTAQNQEAKPAARRPGQIK